MLLKSVIRLNLCLIMVVVLAACSEIPDTPTTTFPLSSPARIAEVDSSTLIVSDYHGEVIHFIDKTSLESSGGFEVKGRPTGVACSNGLVFVGNASVGSVDVYNLMGDFLYHLGGRTNVFGHVNDLVIDEISKVVYVLDSKNKKIRLFNFDGTEKDFSVQNVTLLRPTSLGYDVSAGNLLVSDFGEPSTGILPRIRMLDSGGNQFDEIVATNSGNWFSGASLSQSVPQGTTIFGGYLFVVDSGGGEVQVYDLATKAPSTPIGSRGTENGQLFYPLDVFIDALSKDVFVTDNRNGRITVFRGGAEVLP